MEWWHIYLFTRLDVILSVTNGLILITVIGTIITNFIYIFPVCEGDIPKDHVRPYKKANIFAAMCIGLLLFIKVVIPTQKEAAAIYLLPKLAKSEFASEASKIPADAMKLIRLKMESWIDDLEGENKKIVKEK